MHRMLTEVPVDAHKFDRIRQNILRTHGKLPNLAEGPVDVRKVDVNCWKVLRTLEC